MGIGVLILGYGIYQTVSLSGMLSSSTGICMNMVYEILLIYDVSFHLIPSVPSHPISTVICISCITLENGIR